MHRRGNCFPPKQNTVTWVRRTWVSTYFPGFPRKLNKSNLLQSGRASVIAWRGEAGGCTAVPRRLACPEFGLTFSAQFSCLPTFMCFLSLLRRYQGSPESIPTVDGAIGLQKHIAWSETVTMDGLPQATSRETVHLLYEKPNLNTKWKDPRRFAMGPARSTLMYACSSLIKIKAPWKINTWAWNLMLIPHLLI